MNTYTFFVFMKCICTLRIYFRTNGAWQQKNIYSTTMYKHFPQFPWFTVLTISTITVQSQIRAHSCVAFSFTLSLICLHSGLLSWKSPRSANQLLTKQSRMQQVQAACSGLELQFVKAFMCPVNNTSHYTATTQVKIQLLLYWSMKTDTIYYDSPFTLFKNYTEKKICNSL